MSAVPKAVLTVRLGALPAARRHEICAALAALADCWRHDLGVNGLDSEAVDTQISVGDRPVSVTVSRSSAVLIFIGDSLIVDLLDASLDPRVTLG